MSILYPNYTEIATIVNTLPIGQLAIIVRDHIKTDEIDLTGQLKVFVIEWFTHLGVVSDLQIDRFMSRYAKAIAKIVVRLADGEIATTLATVTLTDQRYVSCSGQPGFYDMLCDADVSVMPNTGATYITCNVIEVFRRKQKWLKKLRGNASAEA